MKRAAASAWAVAVVFLGSVCRSDDGAGNVVIEPTNAVIVAADGDRRAAEELRHHLELVSGMRVPVVGQAGAAGYTFRFDGSRVGDSEEACAWSVGSTETVFRGNSYFAVVDFLENALNVRWPEGTCVSCVSANPIVVGKTRGAWNPQVKIRTVRSEASDASNAVFRAHMRCGSHDRPVYGHAFTQYWTRFGKDHPEYFAMRTDGLRGPAKATPAELNGDVAVYAASRKNRVAMCCTSTGLVEQVVADWLAGGTNAYVNICENDLPGEASCHCRACQALDVVPDRLDPMRQTYYADRYVFFANRVLESARRYRSDVKVCYYAYNATQDAPSRERPDPATVIGLVPTVFTHKHIADYVSSWKKAGAEHFFYRPNQHHYFICPYLPIGSEEHFFEILQYLLSQGTIGFDYDAHAAANGGFEWFERYVILHAMQDPSKPFAYWEDHFCSAYGAAAEDVKAYFRYWREEVWNRRLEPDLDVIIAKGKWFNFGRGLVHNLKDYYHLDDFVAAERHLAAAESRNLPAAQRDLVRRLRTAHDHACLFFRAVAEKSPDNTRALIDCRRRFGYPLTTWSEDYFGDITGIERLLGIKFKKK